MCKMHNLIQLYTFQYVRAVWPSLLQVEHNVLQYSMLMSVLVVAVFAGFIDTFLYVSSTILPFSVCTQRRNHCCEFTCKTISYKEWDLCEHERHSTAQTAQSTTSSIFALSLVGGAQSCVIYKHNIILQMIFAIMCLQVSDDTYCVCWYLWYRSTSWNIKYIKIKILSDTDQYSNKFTLGDNWFETKFEVLIDRISELIYKS